MVSLVNPLRKDKVKEVRKSESLAVMAKIGLLSLTEISNRQRCRLLAGLNEKENISSLASSEMLDDRFIY